MRKPVYQASPTGMRSFDRMRMERELERSLNSDDTPGGRVTELGKLLSQIVERRVGPGSVTLQTFEWIGDRWVPLIVFILGTGTFRHSELHRLVNVFSEFSGATSISQRILTQKLRTLEKAGFLTRTLSPSVPVRTDYELTDLGRSFLALLYQVVDWSEHHEAAIRMAANNISGGL